MTVVPAWNLPGGDGDAVVMPAGLPDLRTGAGLPAHTVIAIRKLDTLDPAQRGIIWGCRRASNPAFSTNHSICFEPGNNNIEFQYGLSPIFELSGNCETVASVWVADCYCDPGNGGSIVLRRILMSTAAQTHSVSGADGGSLFDDGQVQTWILGAGWNGSNYEHEMDGQIAFLLVLDGVVLSQANCESFADDPLAYGDTLCQTHGNACWFFDDTGSDVGDNDIGTPTLVGAAARTAGIGPDVPPREELDPGMDPTILSVGSFNVVYDGEERVTCMVTNLGTVTPLVHLTNDSNGVVNLIPQTVFSYNSGTGTLVIHITLGTLVAGALSMFVTNQTPGDDFGRRDSLVVDVRTNPGVTQIAQRVTVPSQSIASAAAFSLAIAPYIYHSGSQEQGVYSVTGAPPGIAMNAVSGVLAGTLSVGAETTSPYLVKVRLTDFNAAFAEHTFSHAVSPEVVEPPDPEEPPPAGPRVPGSWGLRGRQST